MLSNFEGEKKKSIATETDEEKDLLNFVSQMEQEAMKAAALCVDGKEKIQVAKEDFLTVCSAAAMTHEAKIWNQRENHLLECIVQKCPLDSFPEEILAELEQWQIQRAKDIRLAEMLRHKLEGWEKRSVEA